MRLVDAHVMRDIDARAINDENTPSLDLMENAGRGIFNYILETVMYRFEAPRIAIICGRGNNGGDGFVVGRYLVEHGEDVDFFLTGSSKKLSADCLINYNRIRDLNIPVTELAEDNPLPELIIYDIIIDAVFGTGFSGAPRGITAPVIEAVNDSGALVVAVDAPSGLDVSTGQAEGDVIEADYTATLALPKPGLFVSPGRELAGVVTVIPIGIPLEVEEHFNISTFLITGETVSFLLPSPIPDGHKGDYGKTFILTGSPGMTGAGVMAGMAAARTGSGLVTVGVPESLNSIYESHLIPVMSLPLPEIRQKAVFAVRAKGAVMTALKERDAAAIGPGIGQHHETRELIRRLLPDLTVPAVIDADGLNNLAGDDSPLLIEHGPLILTPHPGEFKRLTGVMPSENPIENYDLLREWCRKFNSVIVLKGSPTLVGSPEGDVYLNPTGNWGMATGGSGDILTGILVALLGMELSPLEAAVCGVYIHGLAGDLAIGDIHPRSLIATDLLEYLPAVFDALEAGGEY